MSSFTKDLTITYLRKSNLWRLEKAFAYHVGVEDSDEVIRIPKGFVCDMASIPRIFWSIIGHPLGKYGQAALLHDYLYRKGQYSRKQSDRIFYEAMGVLKVSQWKRWTMWKAVRIGASIPWRKYRRLERDDTALDT